MLFFLISYIFCYGCNKKIQTFIKNYLKSREDVWEDNYILIQHLGEDSGNCYDSTSYNNDEEPNEDVSQGVSGKVGEAAEFDGDWDYFEIENSNSLNLTGEQITLSAWAK